MPRPFTLLAMSAGSRDLLPAPGLARLAAVAELDLAALVSDFADPTLADRLTRVEILVTGWGCPIITSAALKRMPRLRAIVHAAGSVKKIVSEACWDRGITVSSAAIVNAIPVAEYTLAAILFSGKRVFENAASYRADRTGTWSAFNTPDTGNYHRTVGIIGASRTGRAVARLLRPFDLRVLIHDPYAEEDEIRLLGGEPVNLDELLTQSDVVSVHAPQTPATWHLIDRRRLALMRDGAVLINTARGSLVDADALTEHLVSGRLRAVLDVTDPEPLPAASPLFELPNVLLTPHVAGSLGNEVARMMDFAVEEVARFVRGEPLVGAVSHASLALSA